MPPVRNDFTLESLSRLQKLCRAQQSTSLEHLCCARDPPRAAGPRLAPPALALVAGSLVGAAAAWRAACRAAHALPRHRVHPTRGAEAALVGVGRTADTVWVGAGHAGTALDSKAKIAAAAGARLAITGRALRRLVLAHVAPPILGVGKKAPHRQVGAVSHWQAVAAALVAQLGPPGAAGAVGIAAGSPGRRTCRAGKPQTAISEGLMSRRWFDRWCEKLNVQQR